MYEREREEETAMEEKTFVDVILGEASDRSFDRYLGLVSARILQQRTHAQVFSKGEPQLKVIWIYVCPF